MIPIWVSIIRISHFFDTNRVSISDGIFVSDIIWVYMHYARSFIPKQNHPSINIVWNGTRGVHSTKHVRVYVSAQKGY